MELLIRHDGSGGAMPHLLWLPTATTNPSERHPLLVFLHGAHGRSAALDEASLCAEGVPELLELCARRSCALLAPQCPPTMAAAGSTGAAASASSEWANTTAQASRVWAVLGQVLTENATKLDPNKVRRSNSPRRT